MQVQLIDFDLDYYSSLADKNSVITPSEISRYYIIEVDGKNAGIVGYIPLKSDSRIGFVQIIITSEFRGKGILRIAETMLVKKHKIKKLYATIDDKNISSIKAHERVGFVKEDADELVKLRKDGYLKKNQLRFFMEFSLN